MLPHGLFYYVSLRRSAPRDSVFHFLYNPSRPKRSQSLVPSLCVSGIKRTFVFQEGLCLDTRQPHAYTLRFLFVELVHHAPKLAPANLQDDRL